MKVINYSITVTFKEAVYASPTASAALYRHLHLQLPQQLSRLSKLSIKGHPDKGLLKQSGKLARVLIDDSV